MTGLPDVKHWTLEQFVAWESEQAERFEFVDGRIHAMGGGTAAHSTIVGNIFTSLRTRLTGTPCRPHFAEMQLRTDRWLFYPDVTVQCGPMADRERAFSNPVVVFEILSESTRRKDRLLKVHAYRELPSLRHYVLVEQDAVLVERLTLDDGRRWLHEPYGGRDGVLPLPALGLDIPLSEIYADTGVWREAE